MTQHTIQPLRPDRTKYPPVPYVPVLEYFGVAPRVDDGGYSWAIYHHRGNIVGGYFSSEESAIKALFRLQQSTEFQELVRLSKEYPAADKFLGFNPKVLLQQIKELQKEYQG